ncbi:MAG: roadblock/LC7 domain-containing protein [Promethearchaeota archaeon]|nr:MAG: roadblock/LC7 domain-containing protein [Candidatus Lokiarchaeota archaeon]
MKPIDIGLLERAIRKIKSIMRKQSVNKLTIQRQYLPEIFDDNLLEIFEGLPVLNPSVKKFFIAKGIDIKRTTKEIKFKKYATENLEDLLNKLYQSIPELKAATIVSAEGLPIASILPKGINEERMAAMNAVLLSLGKTAIKEMKKGEFEQLYIKGKDGYLLVLQAGPDAVLTVSTTKDVRLGLIFLETQRVFKKLYWDLSEDENLFEDK